MATKKRRSRASRASRRSRRHGNARPRLVATIPNVAANEFVFSKGHGTVRKIYAMKPPARRSRASRHGNKKSSRRSRR